MYLNIFYEQIFQYVLFYLDFTIIFYNKIQIRVHI